jgi:hypothetical protein
MPDIDGNDTRSYPERPDDLLLPRRPSSKGSEMIDSHVIVARIGSIAINIAMARCFALRRGVALAAAGSVEVLRPN